MWKFTGVRADGPSKARMRPTALKDTAEDSFGESAAVQDGTPISEQVVRGELWRTLTTPPTTLHLAFRWKFTVCPNSAPQSTHAVSTHSLIGQLELLGALIL